MKINYIGLTIVTRYKIEVVINVNKIRAKIKEEKRLSVRCHLDVFKNKRVEKISRATVE